MYYPGGGGGFVCTRGCFFFKFFFFFLLFLFFFFMFCVLCVFFFFLFFFLSSSVCFVFFFWICMVLVAYNYVGYPLVIFLLSVISQAKSDLLFLFHRGGRRCTPPTQFVPKVAVLMSVHNEEAVIEAKVENTFEADYSPDRL